MNSSSIGMPPVLTLDMFDPAPVAVSVWRGPQHELVYSNAVHREIFGERPLGVPAREAFADLSDRDLSRLDRVFRTGEPIHLAQVPVRSRYAHGEIEERYFNLSFSPVSHGETRGVLLLAADLTEQATASEQLRLVSEKRRRALQRYQSLVRAGTETVWVTDPLGRMTEHSPAFEHMTGMSWEDARGEGWLDAVHPEDHEELTAVWSEAAGETAEAFQHRYRLRYHDGTYRHHELGAAPVREEGEVLEWIVATSDIEDRWQQERRTSLLTRASEVLAQSAEVEDALAGLSRVVVPEVADKCSIYLLSDAEAPEDRPLVAQRIAVAQREGLDAQLPPLRTEHIPPGSPFERAVRERRPVRAGFRPEDITPGVVQPGTLQWATEAGAHSMVLVPIVIDGVVVSVADAFVCGNRPPVGRTEMELVREVLGEAHDPLSRGLEDRRTRRAALALQHSLLSEPPRTDDLHIVARYRASPAADEVGGDWYDSLVLPDGSIALIIGDIAGHDVEATVTMSQLRNMLRALALDRAEPPGDVLRRLDICVQRVAPPEATATCIYAEVKLDADGHRVLTYSVAGHPSPLLVTADGAARFLKGAHDPLLGGPIPDLARASATEHLPAGSTLVLYTDGLIERRDEHLGRGMERLRRKATAVAAHPLDAFCDELLTQPAAHSTDDIALIALRVGET